MPKVIQFVNGRAVIKCRTTFEQQRLAQDGEGRTFLTVHGSFPWLGRRLNRDCNELLPFLLHSITNHLKINLPVDNCFFGVCVCVCKSHVAMRV